MAKIKLITDYAIVFDDGSTISFGQPQQCCVCNYADFRQLDDIAKITDFDTDNMVFEAVPNSGFRFGNANKMFFVPCYSEQNGWYTYAINIYYHNKHVLNFNCHDIYSGI